MDDRIFLNDLKQVEKILLTCYGKNGKSALIQSNNSCETASFLLTNDAITILNCMKIHDNHILILLVETIRKHSIASGDNCKILFIYILTFLVDLFESKSNQEEVQNFISFIKKNNLVLIYEELLKEWSSKFNEQNSSVIKIDSIEDFLSVLKKLSVLNDLNSLNKSLSIISSDLICDIIRNNIIEGLTKLAQIPTIFQRILTDLDYILVYSDKYNLDKSKVFKNGFLLNNKVLINHFDSQKVNNAIFLLVQSEETSDVHIEIKSNFEENIIKSFYAQKKSVFSKSFLEFLKSNNVNILLTSNCLSELQKSQLNSQNISLISYLKYDEIRFICNKVGIEPLEIETISSDDFDEINLKSKCILPIDSVEIIESTALTFFKVSKKNSLNFIYFCSPIKLQFGQFKSHLKKVIKTLLIAFKDINFLNCQDSQIISNIFVKISFFEIYSTKLFENLKNTNVKNDEKFLFYKYLIKIFDLIASKLSGQKLLLHRESNESKYDLYEPLGLKFECFINALYFIQSILKIDKIFYVKKI